MSGTDKETLSEIKQKALNLLLRGIPKKRVAKVCCINRSTLYRWLKEPAFKKNVIDYNENIIIDFKNQHIDKYYQMLEGWEKIIADPNHKHFFKISKLFVEIFVLKDTNFPEPNVFYYKGFSDKEHFLEHSKEMRRLWDRLSAFDREEIIAKLDIESKNKANK